MANGAGKFLGGFLLGTAVGTVVGILASPQSGKETRRLLRKSADNLPEIANDISANVQYQADRLTEKAGRTLEDTMERLQEAIAIGKEASQKLRQELSSSVTGSPSLLDEDDTL
jgi:gas vesicle protein